MILYSAITYVMLFLSFVIYRRRFTSDSPMLLDRREQLLEKNIVIFSLIVLWVLTAFRGINIGNDTITYCRYFTNICNNGVNKSYAIEIGFQRFLVFIGKFSTNPHHFLIIYSTLLYGLISFIIFRYSEDKLISLFLTYFFCFGCFCSMLRQGLAMLICFLGYIQLKNNKKLRFVIFVLLAACIHKSALLVLLLLFHKYLPKSNKFLIWVCIIALALSRTSLLLNISDLLGGDYSGYFGSKYAGSGQLGTILSLIRAILIFVIVHDKNEDNKDSTYSLSHANVFYLVFFICCGFTVNLIARISDYYLMFTIIDMPTLFHEKKEKRQLYMALFIYIILYNFLVLYFRPDWNHLYPYEFWKN